MAKANANTIVIAFKTAALDKAKALAKDIDQKVRSALKNIKDVNIRKTYKEKQRELAEARRDDIQKREREIRGDKLRGRDVGSFSQKLRAQSNNAKEGLERVNTLLGVAQSGSISGALTLLGRVPVIGQVAGLAGAVAAIVLPLLERQMNAKFLAQENRILLRERRAAFERDVGKRFAEDIDFRNAQTRQAVDEHQKNEAYRRARGWRRRGRFTVPE